MNSYLKKFIDDSFVEPRKALDLGAGDFSDVNALKQLGWNVEGVDLSGGVDLENYFIADDAPFELVYSNYVVHKIKNQKQFFKTIYDNLADGGYFFLHTFDRTDTTTDSGLTAADLRRQLAERGFTDIKTRKIKIYDNEKGHRHWHVILEATGRKLIRNKHSK
jgi:cyclopropane fatty-acyl-phospholipid synthase-like methyltransferase